MPKVPANTGQRSLPGRVTGRLKAALDLMCWGGSDGLPLEWDEAAARRAGLRTRTMRRAIGKPHVRTYLKEQRAALLAGISAKNISRAAEIRDQDSNRIAALGAIRFLEDGGNIGASAGPVRTPGIVIQIVNK